jgi:Tfp pilus assembly protein PilF
LADAGRSAQAEKEFETALRINPDFADARRQLENVRKNR